MNLIVTDEMLNGTITQELELHFETETVRVSDIISQRVKTEVEHFNQKRQEYFNGLIEPDDAEKTAKGYKLKNKRLIDVEKQIYVALAAFQNNGFFMLVDNQQVEELDQIVNLTANSKVSFMKLTPLVGG